MVNPQTGNYRGFSVIELLIVVLIISIFTLVTAFYLTAYQRLYKADDQALELVDMFFEARQRSLTQREIFRVEIDLTDNVARLIDENGPLDADDDSVVRTMALAPANTVVIEDRPDNIAVDPPESYPVPLALFQPSVYTNSATHNVCTVRFTRNGNVLDAGTDEDGSGAAPTGATFHIWMPDPENPQEAKIARAITIIGSTGAMRFWEWDFGSTNSNKWKDSRRDGSL